MGIIATDEREINLYYHPESNLGEQVLTYLEATKFKIHAVDLSKDKVTPTQWAELADRVGVPIKGLVNTDHPNFTKTYGTLTDIENEEDWLNILTQNPKVISGPILLNGKRAIQVKALGDLFVFLEQES